jgi:hypothetical protein
MHDDDRLDPAALEGVDLPPETIRALITTGVPRELRLPDWLGPTLFTSELGNGRLERTDGPDPIVARTGDHAGYVVGAVRDAKTGFAYAVFVLQHRTGAALLLDLGSADDDRFVNSSLTTLLASLRAFRVAWPGLVSGEGAGPMVQSFRSLLEKLDPPALAHPDHYSPGWLEDLADGGDFS